MVIGVRSSCPASSRKRRWAATPRGREALAEAQHLLRSRGGRVRRSDVDDLERLVLTVAGLRDAR